MAGHTKVYEAALRERDDLEAATSESFNVLVKEMKSLGLNADLDDWVA